LLIAPVVPKHLYNTTIGKVPWFIKRFGAREVVLKPLRVIFAPAIIPFLPRKTFEFQGKSFPCFYHRYNMTWAGERCVEIPIAKSYLDQYPGKNVLEVGNVLSHYLPVSHEVLDKFEKGPGVINEDIIAFHPSKRYDLIISISTFEHIGFDDEASEPSGQKIKNAIEACRGLLTDGGKLVLTVPLGYNPDLDRMIGSGEIGASQEFYLRRVRRLNWEPARKDEALKCRYKAPFPYANAILVAEFLRGVDGESRAA
jgi:SAM-dependent methyltransferase